MPPSDKAIEAAFRLPARVKVNVIPRPDCLGVEWFCGDAEWIKGRSALSAVYRVDGMERGRVPRNGTRIEGVDS
jgi:hypothetical protein